MAQGYSPALDLHLRWEEGRLVWHDPATGAPIASLAEEREARAQAETRADVERGTRIRSDERARADREYARQLEAELRRRRGE